MTKYTKVPKIVKILEVYDDWQWNRKIRKYIGTKLVIGKYYIAEHSKTYLVKEGDCFIIKEKFNKFDR